MFRSQETLVEKKKCRKHVSKIHNPSLFIPQDIYCLALVWISVSNPLLGLRHLMVANLARPGKWHVLPGLVLKLMFTAFAIRYICKCAETFTFCTLGFKDGGFHTLSVTHPSSQLFPDAHFNFVLSDICIWLPREEKEKRRSFTLLFSVIRALHKFCYSLSPRPFEVLSFCCFYWWGNWDMQGLQGLPTPTSRGGLPGVWIQWLQSCACRPC